MDPLSIIASVVALIEAADKICYGVQQLQRIKTLPGTLYRLRDEVKDLGTILGFVQTALSSDALTGMTSLTSLDSILSRATGVLQVVVKKLNGLEKDVSGPRRKLLMKPSIWLSEEVFNRLQQEINHIKATLVALLAAANSQFLQQHTRILSQLMEEWRLFSSHRPMSPAPSPIHPALDPDGTDTDVQGRVTGHIIDGSRRSDLGENPDIFTTATAHATMPTRLDGPNSSPAVPTDQQSPVMQTCHSWCHCQCHKRLKSSFQTPKLMEVAFGTLILTQLGPSLMGESCDFKACRDQRRFVANLEYRFPSWLASMNARIRVTNLPMAGPELQLSTLRRVPDDARSVAYAMQGNIDGLQQLFVQGLASPRDVSASRAFTLMRWALYGGMQNYQTVQFLLSQGATVDDESYENAWDFVLRGKCDAPQRAGLRCIMGTSEEDYIVEQNFPLIHKIVLGLSDKTLDAEIAENRNAVHLTDAQDRTALDWAAARGQVADMAKLLDAGADANNMDVTGRTPVLHAVDSHNADALKLILDRDGEPNPVYPAGISRSSPLTAAGYAGRVDLLRLLLKKEAKPNAKNPEGFTALHSVAQTHNTDCAILLIKWEADLNAVSNNGQTPLSIAIMRNNHAMLRVFMDSYYEQHPRSTIFGRSHLCCRSSSLIRVILDRQKS
jgi:hypothetical protein